MLTERDRINSLRDTYDVGRKEGLAEGMVQGKTEIAKTMKAEGLSADLIAKYTGLTVEQISQL